MRLTKLYRTRFCSLICLSFIQDVLADIPNPTPENFVRRCGHSLAVVGGYLYIDGGTISQNVDGVFSGTNKTDSWPMNETLSISLEDSWTNESAQFNVIPKPAPVLTLAALWEDAAQNAFYMWGGARPGKNITRDKNVWKLRGEGLGGGSWSTLDPANGENFSKIVRTYAASYTACHGTGFYLSGFMEDWITNDDRYGKLEPGAQIPTPGLLTYDFESRIWDNVSTTSYGDLPGLNGFGNQIFGKSQCVSSFGKKGVFIPLGGTFTNRGNAYKDDGRNSFQSMTDLSFYDVASKVWYRQRTTSNEEDGPLSRDRLCITGAQSLNNTYEIFLYGGYRRDTNTIWDDVWVLTIPGFRWFKGPSGVARCRHECATIGNRQMVVVGGLGKSLTWRDPDEFSQGIGIFDMTSMSWSAKYDAKAAPYDSPRIVKEWYNNGGLASVNWTTEDVKQLFTGLSSEQIRKPDSKLPKIIGAAAGAVVGSIVAAAVVVYICRRKRSHEGSTTVIDKSTKTFELGETKVTLSKDRPPQEMAAERTLDPQELSGSSIPPQELECSYQNPHSTYDSLPQRNFGCIDTTCSARQELVKVLSRLC